MIGLLIIFNKRRREKSLSSEIIKKIHLKQSLITNVQQLIKCMVLIVLISILIIWINAKHQLEGNKVNEDSSLNFDKDDHTEKDLEHIKLNTEIKYQEILILKQSLKQKNKEVNELKNSMISLRR